MLQNHAINNTRFTGNKQMMISNETTLHLFSHHTWTSINMVTLFTITFWQTLMAIHTSRTSCKREEKNASNIKKDFTFKRIKISTYFHYRRIQQNQVCMNILQWYDDIHHSCFPVYMDTCYNQHRMFQMDMLNLNKSYLVTFNPFQNISTIYCKNQKGDTFEKLHQIHTITFWTISLGISWQAITLTCLKITIVCCIRFFHITSTLEYTILSKLPRFTSLKSKKDFVDLI